MDHYQYNPNNSDNQEQPGTPNHFNNQNHYTPVKKNGLATASLVFGVLSIFGIITVWFGVIFSVIAITLAVLSKINTGTFASGAVPGITMGLVSLALSLMMFAFILKMLNSPEFLKILQEYMDVIEKAY